MSKSPKAGAPVSRVPTITIDSEAGWLDVTVKTDTGNTDVRLDTVMAQMSYCKLCEAHPDDEAALGDAWVAWLVERGCPPMTHASAFRLAQKVIEETANFRKEFDPRVS